MLLCERKSKLEFLLPVNVFWLFAEVKLHISLLAAISSVTWVEFPSFFDVGPEISWLTSICRRAIWKFWEFNEIKFLTHSQFKANLWMLTCNNYKSAFLWKALWASSNGYSTKLTHYSESATLTCMFTAEAQNWTLSIMSQRAKKHEKGASFWPCLI